MSFNVSRNQHIRHATFVWVVMGIILEIRGVIWVLADRHTHRFFAIILPIAVLIGLLKGVCLLRNSAARTLARISTLNERTPLWRLYSPSTYILILGMVGLGFLCRWAGARWHIEGMVGSLYLVVGMALIAGSQAYWQNIV